MNAIAEENLPLAGMKVLDASSGWGAAVGGLFAGVGADVRRQPVAPPRGGTCYDGQPLAHAIHDRLKTAIDAQGDDLADHLAGVDLLIVSPGFPVDLDALRVAHPALVILHLSDFGMAGSYRDWQATDPVLQALSGELARSGKPGKPPLLLPATLAHSCAAVEAVFVGMIAWIDALRTGRGDIIDFSALEATVRALDPGYGIGGSATMGVPASKLPRDRPDMGHQYPIFDCADGQVRLAVLAPRQWQAMFAWMGSPEEFADPSFADMRTRYQSPTLLPAIARFLADKGRFALEEEGARRGVPIAAVRSLAEAVESEQVQARDVFAEEEILGFAVPVQRGPFDVDGQRVVGKAGIEPAGAVGAITGSGNQRPLEGLRVIDLGVIVVGSETGRILADQGAHVIKVEASAFPDATRSVRNAQGMALPSAIGHRNKQSMGINLRDPRGKALFLDLVRDSDVVLSNFKAGTMASLGLGHDVLAAANPGIVTVESSAYGPDGPWSKRLGYGPLVRAAAGLSKLWSYAGEHDGFSDTITIYPDHVAARVGAFAALALLVRRRRTGQGGAVAISQAEVMLAHLAEAIAADALAQQGRMPDAAGHGPWGVFPCAGDDEWCVVTVRDDKDRTALTAVLGEDAGNASDIEPALREWLLQRGPHEAMTALQAAGVPAGAMLRVAELPDFGFFAERATFRSESHRLLDETFLSENGAVRGRDVPPPPAGAAPVQGEQSVALAANLLGLDDAAIAALVADGVLEVPATFGLVSQTEGAA